MKIFVCRICGEVYVGRELPHSCPFCGVSNKNLRLSHVWTDENEGVELSELSRKNLETSLEIELSNVAFYKSAYEMLKKDHLSIALMFKGLFKVEREHASVFKKLLRKDTTDDAADEAFADPLKCIEGSSLREARAVGLYEKFRDEAVEKRVKEVFDEISRVETDHLELDGIMKQIVNK